MHAEQLSHEEALQELARSKQQQLLRQNILESPHGVIAFSLDDGHRYTSFARAHAETMKHIWGVTPMRDASGRITGLTVFVTDITARREAAEQLAKAQQKLRLSLETQLKQLRGIMQLLQEDSRG